jgi:heat shock protein HtpX
MAAIPTRDLRQMEPVSSFAFAPAFARGNGFSLESVMATHPSLEKRLEQLARISAELGER